MPSVMIMPPPGRDSFVDGHPGLDDHVSVAGVVAVSHHNLNAVKLVPSLVIYLRGVTRTKVRLQKGGEKFKGRWVHISPPPSVLVGPGSGDSEPLKLHPHETKHFNFSFRINKHEAISNMPSSILLDPLQNRSRAETCYYLVCKLRWVRKAGFLAQKRKVEPVWIDTITPKILTAMLTGDTAPSSIGSRAQRSRQQSRSRSRESAFARDNLVEALMADSRAAATLSSKGSKGSLARRLGASDESTSKEADREPDIQEPDLLSPDSILGTHHMERIPLRDADEDTHMRERSVSPASTVKSAKSSRSAASIRSASRHAHPQGLRWFGENHSVHFQRSVFTGGEEIPLDVFIDQSVLNVLPDHDTPPAKAANGTLDRSRKSLWRRSAVHDSDATATNGPAKSPEPPAGSVATPDIEIRLIFWIDEVRRIRAPRHQEDLGTVFEGSAFGDDLVSDLHSTKAGSWVEMNLQRTDSIGLINNPQKERLPPGVSGVSDIDSRWKPKDLLRKLRLIKGGHEIHAAVPSAAPETTQPKLVLSVSEPVLNRSEDIAVTLMSTEAVGKQEFTEHATFYQPALDPDISAGPSADSAFSAQVALKFFAAIPPVFGLADTPTATHSVTTVKVVGDESDDDSISMDSETSSVMSDGVPLQRQISSASQATRLKTSPSVASLSSLSSTASAPPLSMQSFAADRWQSDNAPPATSHREESLLHRTLSGRRPPDAADRSPLLLRRSASRATAPAPAPTQSAADSTASLGRTRRVSGSSLASTSVALSTRPAPGTTGPPEDGLHPSTKHPVVAVAHEVCVRLEARRAAPGG
ncbi:hypothetical protein HK405_008839, partial [Cladochytrium tenue]